MDRFRESCEVVNLFLGKFYFCSRVGGGDEELVFLRVFGVGGGYFLCCLGKFWFEDGVE